MCGSPPAPSRRGRPSCSRTEPRSRWNRDGRQRGRSHRGFLQLRDPHRAAGVRLSRRESLGEDLLAKIELQEIHRFLEEARFGFEFFGATRLAARDIILGMADLSELERIIEFLKLLRLLANSSDRQRMASPAYSPSLRDRDITRIDTVIRYLQVHKCDPITLEQIAALVHMSPKSFCRFFKTNTGKTLIQYVNELRIGEACKKLMETDQAIIEIAFDVGFNNLSNFNRRFRALKHRSPREFRELARQNPNFQNIPLPAQKTFA